MNRLRLIDVRDEIAETANLCATVTGGTTNPALVAITNSACRRLSKRGRWVGLVQRYRITVDNAMIVWPRQVSTIDAVAFCNTPGTIRNEWYEFLGHGPGQLDCDSCQWYTLVDRGTTSTFKDVTPGQTNRKLRVYADVTESSDSYITIQGYDENGNWIRTQLSDETWIDGERILISTTPTLSSKFYAVVTGVYKDETNGVVRVYEYNTTTAANVQVIGYYEPDETTPIYRKSLLPGAMDMPTCDDCDARQITVMVKLRYIPVVNDNDWLMIGDVDAIKLAVKAIQKEDANLIGEASAYFQQAVGELEHELREYKGDGAVGQPRFAPDFGGGNIPC
jgi:hypothetical protein